MKRAAVLLSALLLLLPAARAQPSPVTRIQLIRALWVWGGSVPYDAAGPFSDVTQEDDGATAVAWAYDLGILLGTGGGRCSPYRPVTREETAVLLRRYAARLGRDTFLPDGVAACNDYEGISPGADDSLYWAADTGLIDWSSGGRLDPGGTLTPDALENILIRFSGLSCP